MAVDYTVGMSVACTECPDTEVYSRDRCRRCYNRWYGREQRRNANPYLRTWESARPGYKICRRCEQELSLKSFGQRKTGKDGLTSWCRECLNEHSRTKRADDPDARERERAYESRPDVATRIRAGRAARNYGIPPEKFQEMEARQEGRCAVCHRKRKLAVDHCHNSERVRELLCYPCNIALGQVNDDINLLRGLIDYVERHKR